MNNIRHPLGPEATIRPGILIVEDEGIVAADLQDRVVSLGYDVVGIAGTGEAAVSLAREQKPDAILMDILLRGPMDGIEAAKLIRESLHIPIVFLTANSDRETLERAKLAEPFGFLLKPFVEQEIRTTIEVALYKHKMEEERRKLTEDLQAALAKVKQLSGLLPICAGCKKVRDDEGYWEQVETYIGAHSDIRFTHGLCPGCVETLYPDISKEILAETKRSDGAKSD